MLKDFLIQCIGFAAMGMGIVSYQFNKRKTLLIIQAFMGLTWAVHFLLLKEMTGAAMNLIGMVRAFVYSNRDKKWACSKVIPFVFSASFITASVLTYDGWKSLLPMVAMVMASFVFWSENTGTLRRLNIPCSMLWLVYDAMSSSWAGVANEVFVLVSIAVAMVRFDRRTEK
ncbi:MAG: YgjV family protein [Clostridia bacterium]|nr:YgjV family protein [Clostridia bacterium]